MSLSTVSIELSGICNATCSYCTWQTRTHGKQHMDKNLAISLVNQCKQLGVELVYYHAVGESLLNPHLIEILQHADRSGLKNSLSSNAFALKGDLAYQISQVQSLEMIFSIHWVMGEKFVERCIENVLKYLEKKPNNRKVIVQLVCHEQAQKNYQGFVDTFLPIVEKTPKAELFFKQPCTFPDEPEPQVGFVPDIQSPVARVSRRRTPYSIGRGCRQPTFFLSVLADGTVVPCCVGQEPWGLANAKDSSLAEIWTSNRMQEIRKLWMAKDNSILCGQCLNRKDC